MSGAWKDFVLLVVLVDIVTVLGFFGWLVWKACDYVEARKDRR